MENASNIQAVTLQLPTHRRYQENLDLLLELIEKHHDKKLIIAPEVVLTGFDYERMDTVAKFSILALKSLKKAIKDQIVILTLILQKEEQFVNQAVVIHQHKIVYRQNKTKLFALGGEERFFTAGATRSIKIFEIEGVRYAILICFELRFKDLWKRIEGSDVVIIPAKWGKPRKTHLETLSRALAIMNQCYVIVSNSTDEDMACASAIISPNGEVTQDDSQTSIAGKIDMREIQKMRRYIAMS